MSPRRTNLALLVVLVAALVSGGLAPWWRQPPFRSPGAGPDLQGIVATTPAAPSRSTTVKTPPDP